MIKIDLITGFLGAGKTTFLLEYVRYLKRQGLKVGILEYDYGAINVDMMLLNGLRGSGCELEMVAAACDEDCLKRRFTTKLIAMGMSGYDRVIVEPSGLFDMDMFFDTLRDDPLEQWYEIGSVITIVNAKFSEECNKEADFFLASQVAGAGKVLLSRTQLTDKDTIERTKRHIEMALEEIKCKHSEISYLEKDWEDLGDDDFKMLSECGYRINDYVKTASGFENSFSSVSFLEINSSIKAMEEKLALLFSDSDYGNVFRFKGFMQDEGVNYQINATSYETLIQPVRAGQNVGIVIGNNLNEEKIKKLFE